MIFLNVIEMMPKKYKIVQSDTKETQNKVNS